MGTRAGLDVRAAREGDLERLITIHHAAFPDVRDREARRRNFVENPRGSLLDLRVVESEGGLVAHAFAFSMATWIGGREVPVAGIASVAVAPEARGRGIGRALLESIEVEQRARGVSIALLYPFRHAFYRALGYGLAHEVRSLRVAPEAFPDFTGPGALGGLDFGADLAEVRRCYQRASRQGAGALTRREAVWRSILGVPGRQIVTYVTEHGDVDGYCVWDYLAPPIGMAQEIEVVELVATSVIARRALYGFLHRQRDQSPCVRHVIHREDPLLSALAEPRSPDGRRFRVLFESVGEIGAGTMLKVLDPARALAARGYPAEGELGLQIRGLPPLSLEVRGGVGAVREAAHAHSLSLDLPTLAQLYTGYLAPKDAHELGLVEASSTQALDTATALFATQPFFPLDVF